MALVQPARRVRQRCQRGVRSFISGLLALSLVLACCLPVDAATTFLEPGGDADFGFTLWSSTTGSPTIVADFVHGAHAKSTKYVVNSGSYVTKTSVVQDSGTRISFWIYVVAYPSGTACIALTETSGSSHLVRFNLVSTGKLTLTSGDSTNIATGTGTIPLLTWTRLSLEYTATSTTVNRFEAQINGVSDMSATNKTLFAVAATQVSFGNVFANALLDIRTSDIYVDDSSALTDPGNIWVTAKRPNANGTTNDFNVQIGAGGSGYGSGHSPQVNERPSSDTNGWSVVAAAATTEQYSIESAATGDINLTGATIVDYVGWVRAKSLLSETGSIIVGGTASNISLTSAITTFQAVKGSSSYPAGNTDIGMITTSLATTVSLYECGVVVAFIPGAARRRSRQD